MRAHVSRCRTRSLFDSRVFRLVCGRKPGWDVYRKNGGGILPLRSSTSGTGIPSGSAPRDNPAVGPTSWARFRIRQGSSRSRYSLNGGACRTLTLGPTPAGFRCIGDFNIDLKFSELNHGDNTVVISAWRTAGRLPCQLLLSETSAGLSGPFPISLRGTNW